jgi:hypothetical protein
MKSSHNSMMPTAISKPPPTDITTTYSSLVETIHCSYRSQQPPAIITVASTSTIIFLTGDIGWPSNAATDNTSFA